MVCHFKNENIYRNHGLKTLFFSEKIIFHPKSSVLKKIIIFQNN